MCTRRLLTPGGSQAQDSAAITVSPCHAPSYACAQQCTTRTWVLRATCYLHLHLL